jgi:hypothetical protein
MVFNLNRKMITKESLLQKISDIEVYNMYIKEPINLRNLIHSPLREENKPSFGFFLGENQEVCFKDFVVGSGDCIRFVQLKFGLNYFEAMSKIAVDAQLDNDFIVARGFTVSEHANLNTQSRKDIIDGINSSKLAKRSRKPTIEDVSFWNRFGIDGATLQKYNVSPISHIFFGQKIVKADPLAYAFTERKDGVETYKIYQPYNKDYKWLNNHNESVWQGWEQLPEKGERLIITKSLKDVMAITNLCKIPAISLQAEGVTPKEHVVDQLKERFDMIFLLYDNDYDKDVNWGREFGQKISQKFGLSQIEIDEKYQSKDFSDMVKNCGREIARNYLNEITEIPF